MAAPVTLNDVTKRFGDVLAVDAIDLEKNEFTTIPLAEILAQQGGRYPGGEHIFSIYKDGNLLPRRAALADAVRNLAKGHAQAAVVLATRAVNDDMLSEFTARNNTALRTLIDEHGVELRELPQRLR